MRRVHGAVIGTALLAQLFLPVNVGLTTAAQNPTQDQGMPSGNELLHDCKQAVRGIDGDTKLTEMEFVDASHCTGYVLGVVDGYAVTEAAEKLRLHFSSSLVCFPKTGFMPTPQVVRIVVKYLHDHETRLSEPAALLVLQAMQEAFPCK
jgi:Rap1a immunity proteins